MKSRRRASPRDPADDRVRALFVNTKRRPPLGADTWVHVEIMRNLDRSRVEVHAACVAGPSRRPTPTYESLREIPGITLVKVNLGREIAGDSVTAKVLAVLSLIPAAWSVLRLAWYIRRHGIEVIHTADRPRDAAVCVFLSRITPAKCIVHVHVGFNPDWMRGTLQRSIRKADALIAISDFVADTLREAGCDPSSVYVVLNGIEPERWVPGHGREAIRKELGIDDATPVVVTVCRLFRSKGVSEVVNALYDVRDEVPSAVLLVVGQEMEGGYLDELKALVRDRGLSERVQFLGRRNDVPALMAASDVYAMPSEYEPFGLVYAEAMAMELPIVALDNGGTIEVVEHGMNGLLSAPGDAEALAANLRTLLVDPARRAAFGASGRRRVEEMFTTQKMADAAADVFVHVARPERGDRDRHADNLASGADNGKGPKRNGHAEHHRN
jgi:glycosyltransferase involved in cell wall biosynthesis